MKRKSIITRTTIIILIAVIVILIGLLTLYVLTKKEPIDRSVTTTENLLEHPTYSQYQFNTSDSVINIGTQPMYLPTGVIFEIVKRDQILREELAALGKKVYYYPFFKGSDINFFLQEKLLNGAVGGDMPALSAASNIDIVIPMMLQKGEVSIIAKEVILSNDLEGKIIAYPKGSVSHYFIMELLQTYGITTNQVTMIPMDNSSMAAALHNNEIDLFSTWEPNVTLAMMQYPEFNISYKKISHGYLYFTESFFNCDPKVVNQILVAMIRAVKWIKKDSDNLLMACQWNIDAIEEMTGDSYLLNKETFAHLVKHDLLNYTTFQSLVPDKADLKKNGSLYNEYEFIKSLNNEVVNNNWEQVRNSFNLDVVAKIIRNKEEFQLLRYDYDVN